MAKKSTPSWNFTPLPSTDFNSTTLPPSTTTSSQPLLSSNLKTPPPLYSESESQYLQLSFTPDQSRTSKDRYFFILFCFLNLITFLFGIFACFNRNPNSSNLSSFTYDSTSSSCVAPTFNSPPLKHLSLSLKIQSSSSPTSSDANIFLGLLYTVVTTLFLSIPISFCLLYSLRHYTKQVVYTCLPFFLIVPIFGLIYWFLSCALSSSCSVTSNNRIVVLVVGILFVGLIIWLLIAKWHRILFTIRLIGIASHALWTNLGLFVVLPALNLALISYYVPIGVFLMFARSNGEIVPVDNMEGEIVCGWKVDSWVPFFCVLASLTMLWSTTSMAEAQSYVVSGTVARWYFAKDSSHLKRSIRSSLRNAFGPSSGTICLSGLVVGVVRLIRAAVDKAAREDAGSGIVILILRGVVSVLSTVVEFLNKFTINFAAITGEGYYNSAKMTYELLKRNLLSAVIVEAVSTQILGGIAFILSAIYAVLVCAILYLATDLGEYAYFGAALAWVVLFLVLGYMVRVLNNVTDTVYICYAIDKDKGEVYKQHVHDVYDNLIISRNNVAGAPLNV